MLTTSLEVAGLGLLVAAGYVAAGMAAGLGVAGVCFLVASWRLTR